MDDVQHARRRRLAAPMYDVRRTMYDLGNLASEAREALAKVVREIMWRCWFERFANHAKPGREAGADRAEALGRAYVRGTMYDVRLGCSRALRGGAVAARTPPMYEVQHARRP